MPGDDLDDTKTFPPVSTDADEEDNAYEGLDDENPPESPLLDREDDGRGSSILSDGWDISREEEEK